ncbi:MAG: hypothetical protein KIT43_01475 [Bauldia sp.]|nr:hypothetical protein [Bauldia sp.]
MRPAVRTAVLAAGLIASMISGSSAQPVEDLPTFVFDDFADPATGWAAWGHVGALDMGYHEGAYRIAMASGWPLQLASAGHVVADGRVAIRLHDIAPSAAHPVGLFVRAQNTANFYGFVVVSDGSFAVFHLRDGALTFDTPGLAVLPTGLYLPAPADNDLAIEAGASRLVFLLNGVELFRIENALWAEGATGLLAANWTNDPAGTVFDHWRIDRFTCPISPRPVCAPG